MNVYVKIESLVYYSINTFYEIVMKLTPETITAFQSTIWDFYHTHKRAFIWRENYNPYHIVVSEIMLQQTQTYRVEPKFKQFIEMLPTFEALAQASLHAVLSLWQGLGYNRRGKYLHAIAQKVMAEYGGILPNDPAILVTFPGLGKATAASICAFAFNNPVIFIETNIRAVYLHTFFYAQTDISDGQLMPLIEQTVDTANARDWYYALMDYGVYLKQHMPNPNRKSKHYAVQSKFEGSDRQIRGSVMRILTHSHIVSMTELLNLLMVPEARSIPIIAKMHQEGLIQVLHGMVSIKEQ